MQAAVRRLPGVDLRGQPRDDIRVALLEPERFAGVGQQVEEHGPTMRAVAYQLPSAVEGRVGEVRVFRLPSLGVDMRALEAGEIAPREPGAALSLQSGRLRQPRPFEQG